jgi:cellulose synthase/poly-beta-1,6-N-acetylglucosamine synthase-like glycosyltransferase/peptidoglycan/xylan/chitin deacetylase (PgdA/CDA1 family)
MPTVNRRLVLGWTMVGVVLSAVAAMMLLGGLVTQTTHYPSGQPTTGGATPPPAAGLIDPAAPAQVIPSHVAVLTFTGGPSAHAAAEILAALRPSGVPATFFVTGSQATLEPAALRSIVAAGGEVGNGGFTSADLRGTSSWRRKLELNATQAAIVDATGRSTLLVRPYGPSPEATGDRIQAGAGDLADYYVVPSGRAPVRWDSPGPDAIAAQVQPRGDEGVIVSLPATDAHLQDTLDALPSIVGDLHDRGYRFDTVSAALGLPTQPGTRVSTTRSAMAWLSQHVLRTSVGFTSWFGWLLLLLGILTVLRTVVVTVLALVQERSERRKSVREEPFRDPVTIIVAAFNEEANIAATLTSLLASDHPDLEVIVVDDGSTDGTADILADFAHRVTVLRQRNGGKAAALTYGLSRARHEVIVMVDGDTVFEPTTLAALVAPMSDPAVGAVAGNTKIANRGGMLGRWQHLEYVIGMNLDRRMFQLLDCMPTVPGAVGAFRRAAFAGVRGGVPSRTLAEDTDLTMAINLSGWRVVYAADAIAWTEAPSGIRALAKQRFRWCYGTMQAMWVHRRSVRPVSGRGSGHVGSRGIPYLATFQVVQPLFAPVIDLYLFYALLFVDVRTALLVWIGFTALQLFSAWVALRLDGESAKSLWAVPTTQFVYRQLLYLVVLQSVASALSGSRLRWHQPPRTGAAARQLAGTA